MQNNIYHYRGRLLLTIAISLVAAIICVLALGCSSAQPPASPSPAEDSRLPVESRPAETDRGLNPTIPPSVPTSPAADVSQRELQQRMLDALMLEAARQQQPNNPEYDKFRRAVQQARVCQHCGGAGSYRYVDPNGMLQMRECPSCMGTGKAY